VAHVMSLPHKPLHYLPTSLSTQQQRHILFFHFHSYHAQRNQLQAWSTSNLYHLLPEIHSLNRSPTFRDYQHMVTFVWHPMVLRQRDALCRHCHESILPKHSGDSCVFYSKCLLLCVLDALQCLAKSASPRAQSRSGSRHTAGRD
jgi:hypothetical protein